MRYFLNSNNIHAGEQLGLKKKNPSTEKVLFSFTEEILGALNIKIHIGRIPCDLTIALDCVNHELLLCEISSSHGGEYDIQSCLLGCTAV
jgi:hypothetical protein